MSPCKTSKLYSKCVVTTVLVTGKVAVKAVLYSVYLRRGDPSPFTGLVTVLCNRNGLASYNYVRVYVCVVCVGVHVSIGARIVHSGKEKKNTKRQ